MQHPEHVSEGPDPYRSGAHFKLRWFTPTTEVPLCGHATLAAAAALFQGMHVCIYLDASPTLPLVEAHKSIQRAYAPM